MNIFSTCDLLGERGPMGLRGLPGNSTAGVGLPGPQGRTYPIFVDVYSQNYMFRSSDRFSR
jgi:hypothetical protein